MKNPRPAMSVQGMRILGKRFLLPLLAVLWVESLVSASDQADPKPVLILQPPHHGSPALGLTQQGIRTTFQSASHIQLEPFIECSFDNGPALIDLTGISFQKLLNRVANLPEQTICLYPKIPAYDTGPLSFPHEVLSELLPATFSFVYGNFSDLGEYGTIGGSMLGLEEAGRKQAEIGLRI